MGPALPPVTAVGRRARSAPAETEPPPRHAPGEGSQAAWSAGTAGVTWQSCMAYPMCRCRPRRKAVSSTSMRLDAISFAVPGATEAPDTTAEKRSASSVRAFHLQLWRVESLVEVPASSISKTMAWWSLCVYDPLTVHDNTRGASDSLTNVRSTTELPCRPLKVGTTPVLSVEESERVKQDGRPWSSVRKEGGKFYLRESWWNVDAEKENSANSGPREVGMNSCRALLDFSLHPDSCLAVGIGEPCVGWSEVLVLLTQDGHVDA
uniref:Uncharacterized protein n=1 Tax=Trichogramma kaykai TaxID=54128 RepID=A0ABD2WGU5_9HYME